MLHRHTPSTFDRNAPTGAPSLVVLVLLITSPTGAGRTGA
jgi:hypothetical protein